MYFSTNKSKEVFQKGWTLDKYYAEMDALIEKLGWRCSAIGECGLDYDRLEHSTKEQQLE